MPLATFTHVENSFILKRFDKESYRSRGLLCEIKTRVFNRSTVHNGFVDGLVLTERRTDEYLRFSLEKVPPGLPFIQFSSAVFLRNFILFPFSLLGLAKKRLKFGEREIDRGLDLYCREKQAIGVELPWFFNPDFLENLKTLVKGGFTGDVVYDGATLSFETRLLPKDEIELQETEVAVEFMLKLGKRLEKSQRDPIRSVQRIYRLVTDENVLDKVTWSTESGSLPHPDYPHELSVFYTVLGQAFWTDADYTKKPVQSWLKDPTALEKLPLKDVKAVCTYLTRQERFCDGFWAHAFQAGYVEALLRNPVFL